MKIVIKNKEALCEICEETIETVHRCTHCDKWICHECWEKLEGDDNVKQCPFCPGVFYK